MSLNGDYYDELLAEVRDYRKRCLAARGEADGECLVDTPDRRKVGFMIGKVEAIVGDRDKRLAVLSQLCGRKLETTNEMFIGDVRAWFSWAMSTARALPNGDAVMRARAMQTMLALASDMELQRLVRALPK